VSTAPPALPTEPAPPALRAWDWLRLLLVSVHIFAITVPAVPSPPSALTPKKLQERGAQQAIGGLSDALGTIGLELSAEALGGLVMTLANGVISAREAASRPFAPYYRHAGTRQSWRMFSRVADRPARLEVHRAEGEAWEPLYVALGPEHAWAARTLRSERFRSMINNFASRSGRSTYLGLVRWLTCRRLAEGHAGERLRVQLRRLAVPSPAVLRARGGLIEKAPYWVEERVVSAEACAPPGLAGPDEDPERGPPEDGAAAPEGDPQ
jgi:hypothetical protein